MSVPLVPWKLSDVFWALLTVIVLVLIGGVALGALGTGGRDIGQPIQGELLGVPLEVAANIFQGVVLIGVVTYFAYFRRNGYLEQLGFVMPKKWGIFGVALLLWLGALGFVIVYGIVIDALGVKWLQPPDTAKDILDEVGGTGGAILLAGVWAPLNEEVFFRAFALPAFARRYGVKFAVIASSAVFAAFHVHPGLLLPIFVLGVVLALAYALSGSVLVSIFIHALHNTMAVLIARFASDVGV